FLVTDGGEAIPCVRDELAKRRWRIAYNVCSFEGRWSLKSVKAYLSGEASVDPAGLYAAIRDQLSKYIEFTDPDHYDLVSLWAAGTYFFTLFDTYPYLYFGGIKQSGKTKTLTLLRLLCFNAVFSTDISTAALFRLIQSGRCTLLMDESESLSNAERRQDLRSLLLAGYKRGAYVWRTEKNFAEKLTPESFEVYCPKALANIAGLESTLEDRCINIIMRRGRNGAILDSEPNVQNPVWQDIRDQLYVFALKHWRDVLETLKEMSERSEGDERCEACVKEEAEKKISARERELWLPILTLARFFDSHISQPSEKM
ncbi:hypothetical protein KEJ34_03335, partial [Candidatus Bathyarchaeota archaeon]|nr:hypothetical protein [Candidatus Bathyarchaeota archaeon]